MPQQTTTGVGAGSRGIGVILSVRDIIISGKCLPPFQWEWNHQIKFFLSGFVFLSVF